MLKINNVGWRFAFVPSNYYKLQMNNGDFTIGACDNSDKVIYISDSITNKRLLKKVICHELTHAAMFSYNILLDPAEEELIADLIATYGEEIINITNKIFIRLKEKRGVL